MPRLHESKAPPKPTTRPCALCDQAVWRFNGRAWYASDAATRRRHVCDAATSRSEPVTEVAAANGGRSVHEPSSRRGVPLTALVAAALVGLGGLYATRTLRR